MNMKLAMADLQIDNKKLQMERDIDIRDKQYEILRLRKEIEVVINNAGISASRYDS